MQHFVAACVPTAFEESPELQIECTLRKRLYVKTDDHVSVSLGWSSVVYLAPLVPNQSDRSTYY